MVFRRGYKLSHLLALGCGGFLFLVVLAAFVLPSLVPLPDVDPVPEPQGRRPAEENGWPLLRQAAEAVRGELKHADHPAFAPGGSPDLLAYLDGNAGALSLLDQALAQPYLEIPRVVIEPMGAPVQFEYLGKIRELARLKVQRAYLARERADLPAALDDALDVVVLGYRLQNSGAALIDHLVGQAVTAVGNQAIRRCLGPPAATAERDPRRPDWVGAVPKLTTAERRAVEATLARLVPEEELQQGAQRALAGEFQLCRGLYEHPERMAGSDAKAARGLARLGRVPTIVYDGPRTAAMAQERTLAFQRLAAEPRWDRDLAAEPALAAPSGVGRYYNCMGRTLVGITEPTLVKWLDKLDHTVAGNRLTCIVLAMRLYVDDHGRLPSALPLLRDAGLPADKLVDPFDHLLPYYWVQDAAVSCVGANGKDDFGGQAGKPRIDDVVAAIEFVPPSRH